MSDEPKREKIAILGGGAGALSAAFGLTEGLNWSDRYEITVYQLGWRLGGKGASGRNPRAQQRIEEHGLHVWAGFYENAFRVIRACYDELGRRPDQPLATWRDAFKPHNFITVEEQVGGRWVHWHVNLPTNPLLPGDGGGLPTVWEYVPSILQWMIATFVQQRNEAERPDLGGPAERLPLPGWLDQVVRDAEAVLGIAGREANGLLHLQNALKLARALPLDITRHPPAHHQGILWLVDRFMERLERLVRDEIETHDEARRLWVLMDFAAAHLRGLLIDGVVFRGFDYIDDWEWSDWLRKHGASELTMQSPLVRGTYDYIFGFRQGDTTRPAVAAGTCIRGLLRLAFTYKGAVFWEMQAGMGDTVFAPLYLVLKERGVRFEFFHRVRNLGLSEDGQSIATIRMGRQVTLRGAEYDPLLEIKGLPCWPSEPRYEQIVEGAELEAQHIDLESAWTPWPDREVKTLEVDKHFHRVILGISLAALKDICPDVIKASGAWQDMVGKLETVSTQAVQLWLGPDAARLGWKWTPALLTAYAEPFDTYADMSHLIKREAWPAEPVPRSIAYFCGPLKEEGVPPPSEDTDFPGREKARVKKIAMEWLQQNAGHLWPDAAPPGDPNGFDWEKLIDPNGGIGPARFDGQYWRANVNPSDRYVLSVPGSTRFRLEAGKSGFSNLYLAGDWVRTGINAGCVEAAVMAGLQAARAISGYPEEIFGETDEFRELPFPLPVVRGVATAALGLMQELVGGAVRTLEGWGRSLLPFRAAAPGTPAYVEWGGEQVFPQPLQLQEVSFYSFMLDADFRSLRAVCDRYLNGPAGGRVEYHPLVPRVLLAFASIGRASCADPPDSQKGWMSEVDVAFWVPVVAGRRVGPLFLVERVAWFLPYVFVNNAWASATGREIYGFPKEIGTFDIPASSEHPARLRADTLVLDRYHPTTEASFRPIVEVVRTDHPLVGALAKTWTDLREAFKDFSHMFFGDAGKIRLPGLGLVFEVFQFLTHERVPMVFLKQFRDVADGRRSAYQAIVEAPARLVALREGGQLDGDYQVTVHAFDSHPIGRELGLNANPQPARGAWYTVFDFVMEKGREIVKK